MSIISLSSWVRAHQNRGKLIYETFVKDYVVFSLVVKVKLLFMHTTDGAEIEDIEENVKKVL